MVGDTTQRLIGSVPTTTDRSHAVSFLKWAGWSGLIGTLAFIVTIVMTTGGVANPEGPADMARFLDEVAAGGSMQYVYGIAGIALVVLYIPMSMGVYRLLGRTTSAWYGSAAVVFGLAILLPAYLINLLPPLAFVPLAGELGAIGGEVLYADYSIVRVAAELFFTVGSVLSLAVGPFLWGLAWLRSMDSGRWIALSALITGVTGLVWFVWLIESPVISTTLIVNVLMSLVFFTAASVVLVARAREA